MIKLKGGTASAMSTENPVLADRQPGFARTDNGGILKIGDGVTPWNDLPGVGPGKRIAHFTVGTSTAGWTALDCDYLCDGTADDVEINTAIQALPNTGGEIVILDGTYNITATIAMNKDNIKLSGNGNATVLKRMWNSLTTEGVITVTATNGGCCIENLFVDGNLANYQSSNNYGIRLSNSDNNTITGNTCNNNSSRGIYLINSNNTTITGNTCSDSNRYGIYLNNSNTTTITGNTCNNNNYGINLSGVNSNNTITGNTCNNNSSDGIFLNTSDSNNTITGNTCSGNQRGINLSGDNNTITGNTCNNNNYGIYLINSDNNTITGNTCNNNSRDGIYLSNSNTTTITGNTCIRGTGQSSDYTKSQYTIRIDGSSNNYNLIAYNNIMGKDVVIDGGTSNTSVGNKYS